MPAYTYLVRRSFFSTRIRSDISPRQIRKPVLQNSLEGRFSDMTNHVHRPFLETINVLIFLIRIHSSLQSRISITFVSTHRKPNLNTSKYKLPTSLTLTLNEKLLCLHFGFIERVISLNIRISRVLKYAI